ncbi:MAG TPA: FhaA domain-containing protein [Syntrophorhabdaceae bacterium]|jgi:hypothetical protein
MKIMNLIRARIDRLFGKKSKDLQPRDILDRLLGSMEERKMGGFDRKYLVPNRYTLYLNPFDYEDISPFLAHAGEQLKHKVLDRIKKKGYTILSPSLFIDIRKDESLLRNQLVIKSSFLEVNNSAAPAPFKAPGIADSPKPTLVPRRPMEPKDKEPIPEISGKTNTKVLEERQTRVREEGITRCLDAPLMNLEVIEGTDKGVRLALKEGEYVFGRARDADILLKDPEEYISRKHFKVVVAGQTARIRDLGGKNKTFLNDIEIAEASLNRGDIIRVGRTLLRVA